MGKDIQQSSDRHAFLYPKSILFHSYWINSIWYQSQGKGQFGNINHKGKMFFEFDANLTTSIHAILVNGSMLWIAAGLFIYCFVDAVEVGASKLSSKQAIYLLKSEIKLIESFMSIAISFWLS